MHSRLFCCCTGLVFALSLKSADKGYQVIVQPSSLSSAKAAIKGSLHPEQIPDMTAYKLVFRAFSESPNSTGDEKLRQQVKLASIGLNKADTDALSEILGEYHTQHAVLTSQYEAEIKDSNRGMVKIDHPAFAARRNLLVVNTRQQVQQRLSADGAAKLHTFIQREKRGMTVVPNPPMF